MITASPRGNMGEIYQPLVLHILRSKISSNRGFNMLLTILQVVVEKMGREGMKMQLDLFLLFLYYRLNATYF